MMIISTLVDSAYYPYIPLFQYCAKKAYPEYECVVFTRGDTGIPGTVKVDDAGVHLSHYNTAAMRFICGEEILAGLEYCLITDCDILIFRENKPIMEQHLNFMQINGLSCYCNSDYGDRMLGVHFVTKAWWEITRKARMAELERLKNEDIGLAGDEIMLLRIVQDSGLKTIKFPVLWNNHGLHLGRFRNKSINACRLQHNEYAFIISLLGDAAFMELLEVARKSPMVDGIWCNIEALIKQREKHTGKGGTWHN